MEELRTTTENLKIFGVKAQIQTGHLLKHYRLIHLAGQKDGGRRSKTRLWEDRNRRRCLVVEVETLEKEKDVACNM
jgi:hypothetical protein